MWGRVLFSRFFLSWIIKSGEMFAAFSTHPPLQQTSCILFSAASYCVHTSGDKHAASHFHTSAATLQQCSRRPLCFYLLLPVMSMQNQRCPDLIYLKHKQAMLFMLLMFSLLLSLSLHCRSWVWVSTLRRTWTGCCISVRGRTCRPRRRGTWRLRKPERTWWEMDFIHMVLWYYLKGDFTTFQHVFI